MPRAATSRPHEVMRLYGGSCLHRCLVLLAVAWQDSLFCRRRSRDVRALRRALVETVDVSSIPDFNAHRRMVNSASEANHEASRCVRGGALGCSPRRSERGTGKTHAIADALPTAVIEGGLLPEQILVVTFTRAATGELRERVRARLRLPKHCLGSRAFARSGAWKVPFAARITGTLFEASFTALLMTRSSRRHDDSRFCARCSSRTPSRARCRSARSSSSQSMPWSTKSSTTLSPRDIKSIRGAEILALRSIGMGAERLRSLAESRIAAR